VYYQYASPNPSPYPIWFATEVNRARPVQAAAMSAQTQFVPTLFGLMGNNEEGHRMPYPNEDVWSKEDAWLEGGEDAHLEAEYEDRFYVEDDDYGDAY
jgi:hypothetical protein